MFSFQNEAINFMNNGEVTVRVLAQFGLIPEGQCAIPNQFFENGWGIWLPMPNVTFLPFFSFCIANGLCKKEILIYLEQKAKPNTFINFSRKSLSKTPEHETDEYELLYAREIEIKRRLEVNGYRYPKCISDVVNLYVSLGLAFELRDQEGEVSIDFIICPLKKIDEVLLNA